MIYDEFPHVITFQEAQKVSDGGGGSKTSSWVDKFTTDAYVNPITGQERYISQQAQYPVDYNVFYPTFEGVAQNMRIKWGEKILTLKSKPIPQGDDILLLKCEEQ